MTDPKKTAPKQTAEEAYVRAHGQATELLDAIQTACRTCLHRATTTARSTGATSAT
jgi:hypothetical protein